MVKNVVAEKIRAISAGRKLKISDTTTAQRDKKHYLYRPAQKATPSDGHRARKSCSDFDNDDDTENETWRRK
jgi:hypothetical protein